MTDDAELLRRYAFERSEEAFAALVQQRINLVYRTALNRVGGNPTLAGEVTQSVFADLARKSERLSRHAALVGWLFTSTRYAATAAVRAEQRRLNLHQEFATMIHDDSAADPKWHEARRLIEQAMDRLREPDRVALLLRFFDGLSLAEVGARVGLSEEAARKRVDRALERLRAVLARSGIASTAAALGAVLAEQPAMAAPPALRTAIMAQASAHLAGVGGGFAALFQLMTSTKALASSVALMTLLSVGGAWWYAHAQPINPAPSAPPGVAAAVPAPSASPTAPPAPVVPMPKAESPATVVVAPTPKPAAPKTDPYEDPVFRAKLATLAKARLDSTYGPLFQQLHLTADQVKALKDLLIEKQFARTDAARAARVQGLERGDDLFAQAIANSQADVDGRIKALVGDNGFATYGEFESSFGYRMTINRLADALQDTDPLTDQQKEDLLKLCVANSHKAGTHQEVGMGIDAGAGLTNLRVNTIAGPALRKSKAILSPTQFEAMQDLQLQLNAEKVEKAGHAPRNVPTN
jgi:RNA polymerase sigma factor (sigma-70 family)